MPSGKASFTSKMFPGLSVFHATPHKLLAGPYSHLKIPGNSKPSKIPLLSASSKSHVPVLARQDGRSPGCSDYHLLSCKGAPKEESPPATLRVRARLRSAVPSHRPGPSPYRTTNACAGAQGDVAFRQKALYPKSPS